MTHFCIQGGKAFVRQNGELKKVDLPNGELINQDTQDQWAHKNTSSTDLPLRIERTEAKIAQFDQRNLIIDNELQSLREQYSTIEQRIDKLENTKVIRLISKDKQ